MTNYSVDEEERDDQKNIKELLRHPLSWNQRPHPDTSKGVRQWDAQTQTYVNIKEEDEEEEFAFAIPVNQESQKQREQRLSYQKEEVTNPDHYDKVGFAIQPIEYITANELDFLEGNVIKYVSRYPHKGGLNDLLKARTYIEFLIERERKKEW
jgi:hypothetical protein